MATQSKDSAVRQATSCCDTSTPKRSQENYTGDNYIPISIRFLPGVSLVVASQALRMNHSCNHSENGVAFPTFYSIVRGNLSANKIMKTEWRLRLTNLDQSGQNPIE